MNPIEVEIAHGKIRGARIEGINIFKGILYGGKVSGDQRFRRLADLKPWSSVRVFHNLGLQETYEVVRQPATAKIVQTNRREEPDIILQIVEERAPDGFERVEDVISAEEREAINTARDGRPVLCLDQQSAVYRLR